MNLMTARSELLQDTRKLLARAGFYCSEICNIRPSSFDFIARRDDTLLMIKVLSNIDAMNYDVAHELISVAKRLDAIPVVIGRRTCTGYLEDDIVYFRYGVPIITYETLKNYLLGMPPVIATAPGGYYVNIDGERLRRIRKEKGISIGQLARVAGVTRRAVRMYEEGERASIEIAEKMVEFLGEEIIKPVDLMEQIENEIVDIESKIDNEMLALLENFGSIFPTRRSPFHAISEVVEEKLLVGVRDRRVKEKAKLIANISKVAERHSFIIAEQSARKNIEGLPVIERKEILKIDSAEEFLDLIIERE